MSVAFYYIPNKTLNETTSHNLRSTATSGKKNLIFFEGRRSNKLNLSNILFHFFVKGVNKVYVSLVFNIFPLFTVQEKKKITKD